MGSQNIISHLHFTGKLSKNTRFWDMEIGEYFLALDNEKSDEVSLYYKISAQDAISVDTNRRGNWIFPKEYSLNVHRFTKEDYVTTELTILIQNHRIRRKILDVSIIVVPVNWSEGKYWTQRFCSLPVGTIFIYQEECYIRTDYREFNAVRLYNTGIGKSTENSGNGVFANIPDVEFVNVIRHPRIEIHI